MVQHMVTIREVARERMLEFRYLKNTSGESKEGAKWQYACSTGASRRK